MGLVLPKKLKYTNNINT